MARITINGSAGDQVIGKGNKIELRYWGPSQNVQAHWVNRTNDTKWGSAKTVASGSVEWGGKENGYAAAYYTIAESTGKYVIQGYDDSEMSWSNAITITVPTPPPPPFIPDQPTLPPDSECISNWVCYQPLDGWEKDGCGRRRQNSLCDLVTTPSPPPCTPAWICELPLNGYESDGCGNRRFNPACKPKDTIDTNMVLVMGMSAVVMGVLGYILYEELK